MKKWNCDKHEYEEYSVPNNWDIRLISERLKDIINCASCGKKVEFGNTYASKLIHNAVGLGYCVCEECYKKEMEAYYKEEE